MTVLMVLERCSCCAGSSAVAFLFNTLILVALVAAPSSCS
jgi:hypothetical protein